MKVKINTMQLFMDRSNIREFLSIELSDEDIEWLEEEHGLTARDIEVVLKHAKMYVKMEKLPETLEVEVEVEG